VQIEYLFDISFRDGTTIPKRYIAKENPLLVGEGDWFHLWR